MKTTHHNKSLHRTAFPLRSKAAGELGRCPPTAPMFLMASAICWPLVLNDAMVYAILLEKASAHSMSVMSCMMGINIRKKIIVSFESLRFSVLMYLLSQSAKSPMFVQ
jgi:hypothetical protein